MSLVHNLLHTTNKPYQSCGPSTILDTIIFSLRHLESCTSSFSIKNLSCGRSWKCANHVNNRSSHAASSIQLSMSSPYDVTRNRLLVAYHFLWSFFAQQIGGDFRNLDHVKLYYEFARQHVSLQNHRPTSVLIKFRPLISKRLVGWSNIQLVSPFEHKLG